MGHAITAIITSQNINEAKAEAYDLPFVYEKGFCIIFLEALHTDIWTAKIKASENIDLTDEGTAADILLDCKFTHYIAKALGISQFALIETDYFGGIGTQWACVYKNSLQTMPTTEGGINQALQKIGVMAEANLDAFDTLNLSNYRSYEGILLDLFPDKYQRWCDSW